MISVINNTFLIIQDYSINVCVLYNVKCVMKRFSVCVVSILKDADFF